MRYMHDAAERNAITWIVIYLVCPAGAHAAVIQVK